MIYLIKLSDQNIYKKSMKAYEVILQISNQIVLWLCNFALQTSIFSYRGVAIDYSRHLMLVYSKFGLFNEVKLDGLKLEI